jgi:hypothetical protein
VAEGLETAVGVEGQLAVEIERPASRGSRRPTRSRRCQPFTSWPIASVSIGR